MQLSDLQYLMGQLGPATADILRIVQDSDDQWQVELDAGLSLQVGWLPQRQCITFSCGLGHATLVERENVYALLLNANLLLAGIAGARLALSQPDDEVMLIGEYTISPSSMDDLHQALREFVNLALKYAELIVSPIHADLPAHRADMPMDVSQSLQRV